MYFRGVGERICRRGIERPCYKIAYHQDSTLRVGFDDARRACRDDDGELLSIESENEQKLMEKFIRGSNVAYGDVWIGLRRNQGHRESGAGNCLNRYYWLDRSSSMYRYDLTPKSSWVTFLNVNERF